MKPVQNLHSKTTIAIIAVCSFLAAILAHPATAAPGDLDPTFDIDGKVLTDFSGHADTGAGVVLQTDGKIIVSGLARSGTDDASGDFAVARYNTDGTLDSTFGTAGKVSTDFEGNFEIASAVAIQADGKIVAAGRSQNAAGIDFALARYNSDGNLDSTFGPNHDGKVRTVFSTGISRIYEVAIQNDQKIVAAGRAAGANVTDLALARYNTDGSLDPTFGSNGLVTTDFSSSETAFTMVILPDQKIVVAGSDGNFLLARYNSDGTLDTTFGPDGTGRVRTPLSDNGSLILSIALQPDGALVAAGAVFLDFVGIDLGFALARYLPDGTLDQSFGSGGTVATDFSTAGDAAMSVVVQTDGSIIAGGYGEPGNDSDFILVRYHADGSLDSAFGAGGSVTTDFGSDDAIQGIVLQSDGKLVAAGGGGPEGDFALARYFTDGSATKAQPLNISTRAEVGTEDAVLIGGFIINGNGSKKIILRAIGPSLPLGGVLADPTLELHKPDGTLVSNDNWRDDQEQEINDSGYVPANDLESAIVATLDQGAYTVILRGQAGGTGVALVEAYDLDGTADPQLANVSTRGAVGTGDNVMIGGFILGAGGLDTTVIVRGIGPSLGGIGVIDPLPDPTLDLYNDQGAVVASNDDWKDTQQTEIEGSGHAPGDDRDAAILIALSPGAYTAIVRGKDNATGIALVEAYNEP